jgi:hypothetical protein
MPPIPWRSLSQRIVTLSLLGVALVVLSQAAAAQVLAEEMSTLTVTVQLSPGGATHVPTPRVGAQVQVAPVSDNNTTPIATAVTDNAGTATFTLPAGSYWVYLPAAPPDRVRVAQRALPNGRETSGWTQVDLGPGADVTASITLRNLAP